MSSAPGSEPWFSVRCIFRLDAADATAYEERITLWRADSFDNAIALAEHEANEYAAALGAEYVGLAQAFHLAVEDRPVSSGDEVFSLVRVSDLASDEYVTRYFDVGTEREQTSE